MQFIRRVLALFGMFRDVKHDQGLPGWSMLDHDDTVVDICDFDEHSSSSQHLFEDVDSDAVNASTADSSLSGERKREQEQPTFAVPAQLARQRFPVPVCESTTPEEQKSGTLDLAPNLTPTSPQASASCSTGFDTDSRISCFVPDKTQATGTCVRLPRKRRKIYHLQGNQCAIDESSNDDSAGDIYHKSMSVGARTTIDEVTEDELNSSADTAPRSLGMCNVGSQLPALENPSQPVFKPHDIHVGGGESPEQMQSAIKNGFEERLLIARQRESSELTLWQFYKENAHFPKMLCPEAAEALTARVLTIESIYGIAYCACEVDTACNVTSKICLTLPLELAESEKLDCGAVLRIFPPWREHTLFSGEKVLSAVQYLEVLERPPPETVD
ncbi:uncharacterized protein LOC144112868 [Amblyomma americanum]